MQKLNEEKNTISKKRITVKSTKSLAEADNKENFFELEIAKDVTIKILKQSVGEAIKDKAQKPATSKKLKK